jgi:hypothetical protein
MPRNQGRPFRRTYPGKPHLTSINTNQASDPLNKGLTLQAPCSARCPPAGSRTGRAARRGHGGPQGRARGGQHDAGTAVPIPRIRPSIAVRCPGSRRHLASPTGKPASATIASACSPARRTGSAKTPGPRSTLRRPWERTQIALASSDLELRKVASLDAFLRIAVGWEGFRSRWHIAVINRDSSAYRVDVERRFRASVKGGKFSELEPFVHVGLPAQLSMTTVQRLLDPLGRNISFCDKWTDRAGTELATHYAAKVRALSPADLLLVAACEKIRNAVVHRSPSSVGEMNTALAVLDPTVDAGLVRTSRVTETGIAAYLHARPLTERRVEVWHQRLRDVAGKLRT